LVNRKGEWLRLVQKLLAKEVLSMNTTVSPDWERFLGKLALPSAPWPSWGQSHQGEGRLLKKALQFE